MSCYRDGGCGPYEMLSCSECPASNAIYKPQKQTNFVYDPKQTNYDRIISKTPEELANFLGEIAKQAVGQYILAKGGVPQKWDYQCHHCWLDWLKQEAK